MSDELLARVRSGDPLAVEQLVLQNLDWLRRRVSPRLDPSLRADRDSGDLVQDAVVQLLESGALAGLRDEEHLRGLLQRIVGNDLVDLRRRRGARQFDPHALLWKERSVTRPSQHAERVERHELLQRALAGLGADDRRVLQLRVWEERSFAGIAAVLGCAEDAARMRCNRALARLADLAEAIVARAELRVPGSVQP
jgi:RNA polymerase sigma factor (sigma-70 family)